jgi:hypothetical protein
MEALAAIGLAGNIVQFVDFTSSLISKTCNIYRSTSNPTHELSDFKSIAKHLHEYTETFERTTGDHGGIALLASRCNTVARELLRVITDLDPRDPAGKTLGKWGSFRLAWKSVRKKEEISALHARLDSLRDELMLYLVSKTR